MKTRVVEDVLEDGTITKRFVIVDTQRKNNTPDDFHSPKVDAAREKRDRRKLRNIKLSWALVQSRL